MLEMGTKNVNSHTDMKESSIKAGAPHVSIPPEGVSLYKGAALQALVPFSSAVSVPVSARGLQEPRASLWSNHQPQQHRGGTHSRTADLELLVNNWQLSP